MSVICVFEWLCYVLLNITRCSHIVSDKNNKKTMNNGKIYDFFKGNWHYFLFGVALFAGVLCGVRACSKSIAVDVNARRNVITFSKTK